MPSAASAPKLWDPRPLDDAQLLMIEAGISSRRSVVRCSVSAADGNLKNGTSWRYIAMSGGVCAPEA